VKEFSGHPEDYQVGLVGFSSEIVSGTMIEIVSGQDLLDQFDSVWKKFDDNYKERSGTSYQAAFEGCRQLFGNWKNGEGSIKDEMSCHLLTDGESKTCAFPYMFNVDFELETKKGSNTKLPKLLVI
jgi:hypothetical protein